MKPHLTFRRASGGCAIRATGLPRRVITMVSPSSIARISSARRRLASATPTSISKPPRQTARGDAAGRERNPQHPRGRANLLLFSLRRHGLHGRLHLLRIAEVVAIERLEIVVQLIDKRHPGRNVELDDIGLAHVI